MTRASRIRLQVLLSFGGGLGVMLGVGLLLGVAGAPLPVRWWLVGVGLVVGLLGVGCIHLAGVLEGRAP
jgi:hypothetical protein